MRIIKILLLCLAVAVFLPVNAQSNLNNVLKYTDPNPPGNPANKCRYSGSVCAKKNETCCENPDAQWHSCEATGFKVTDCCLDNAHYCTERSGKPTYCNYEDYQGQKIYAGCVSQDGKQAYY